MKEIGGFLELEKNSGHEYHEKCIALNSGRNCLRYLIRAREIKKIWLPKLLCSAISDTCREEKVEITYYSINEKLRPALPDNLNEDWLYLINYYGQYSDEEIRLYSQEYKNLIVDNAQAFYEEPIDEIDTIYTCRKFFGVSDGGYLYTKSRYKETLFPDTSYERVQFLAGRFEESGQAFYEKYRENEEKIDRLPLKLMSKITHNFLQGIDYISVARIREQNYIYLHQHLKNINKLQVILPVGPYMYPLYVENGAKIREELKLEKIYVPILWPNVKQELDSYTTEYRLADNIVPLPCDQRYSLADMGYVVEKIKKLEEILK